MGTPRSPARGREILLPPRHGRPAVFVFPAELDLLERAPVSVSYVLVVDASASEGPSRVVTVRAAAVTLLGTEGRTDRLGVVVLKGKGAEVMVPATGSAERARRQLAVVQAGGRPPLASGLRFALQVAAAEATRPDVPVPLIVLVSDGLSLKIEADALVPAARISALGLPSIVLDTSPDGRASALGRIAEVMGARLLRIPGAEANVVAAAARGASILASREARWRAPRRRARR